MCFLFDSSVSVSAIDVSATTPTLPSLDAARFLSVWSSESSLTAHLVRSWVNSVTSHFKTVLFHLLQRCTLSYSVRYHMRRTLLVMNIVPVVLGIIIIYGMGSAVFVFGAPFPNVRVLIPARGLSSPTQRECVEFR